MLEKYSYFAVVFDHDTKTFSIAGDFIDGIMDGCMLVGDEDEPLTNWEWRYPETDEENEADSKASRKLQLALDAIPVETLDK